MAASSDPKRYYGRLGTAPSASAEEIKRAQTQDGLQKLCIPDPNRDVNAKKRDFTAISRAYGVLSDPDLRRAYDALQYTNPEPQKSAAELGPPCCSRCGQSHRPTALYRLL